MTPPRTITPVLRYRDPNAAAEWLCKALGFSCAHTAADPRGQPHYISLRLGDCYVLVCPAINPVLHDLMAQPEDLGGANTQICYLTVQDLEAHSRRAAAAGAAMELAPQDDGAGGRFYMCRDPEGHLWSVGTRSHAAPNPQKAQSGQRKLARRLAPVAAVLLALGGWVLFDTNYRSLSQPAPPPPDVADSLRETVADELTRRLQAEKVAKEAVEKLKREQAANRDLKDEVRRLQADLSHMRRAKEDADRAMIAAKAASALAEQSAKHATEAFIQERAAASAAARKAHEEHLAKIAQLKAAIAAERERGTEAFVLERAAARTAQKAHEERVAKIAQLEAAVRAERELRIAAEIEVTSLREQLARSQQSAAPTTAKEKTAALAVTKDATPQDESHKTVAAAPPSDATKVDLQPASPCASVAQDKIPFGHRGSKTWDPKDLARLCEGAETSAEPAKCFGHLMTGKVSWGGGKIWKASNALALCAGTPSANKTIECFTKELGQDLPWRTAIARCRSG